MPPRSNEFQRLIRLIEEQLAPSGAKVEESAMVPDDHDGTLREVDILVRIPAGQRELRVGIECRDHKRKADAPWIEAIRSKYEFLPIDRRVVVSRRGFSKAALGKAKLWHIECLTLDAAARHDWAAALADFAELKLLALGYLADKRVVLRFVPVEGRCLGPMPPHADLLLRFADGRRERLETVVHRIMRTPWIRAGIERECPTDGSGYLGVEVGMPAGCTAADLDGEEWAVAAVALSVRHVVNEASAPLTHASYSDTAVATGGGTLGQTPFTVAMTQQRGGPVGGRMVLRHSDHEVTYMLPEPRPRRS